jgi:hypothetical protein
MEINRVDRGGSECEGGENGCPLTSTPLLESDNSALYGMG